MNQDQLMGAVRTIMSAIGGYVMGRGWLTSDQVTLIGGVATALIPLLWSYASHTDRAKVAAAMESARELIRGSPERRGRERTAAYYAPSGRTATRRAASETASAIAALIPTPR